MSRSVNLTRFLFFLLLASYAGWGYVSGLVLANNFNAMPLFRDEWKWLDWAIVIAPSMVLKSFLLSRWHRIAASACLGLTRPLVVMEIVFSVAMLAEFSVQFHRAHDRIGGRGDGEEGAMLLSGLLVIALAHLITHGRETPALTPKAKFFLWDRSHVASRDARICLLGMIAIAVLAGGVAGLLFSKGFQDNGPWIWPEILRRVELIAGGFLLGLVILLVQGHWCRSLGFVPWGFFLLTVSLAARSGRLGAKWQLCLFGAAIAWVYLPLLLGMIAATVPRQRLWASFLQHGAAAVAAVWALVYFARAVEVQAGTTHAIILTVLSLLATIAFTYLLFRPFVEQIAEMVFRPLWYPVAFGPGACGLPTRGPLLVIGNHGAMFDPVWLAGVLPLRIRAMMISTILDKPFIRWLAGRVFQAIRVPNEGFRRTAPELEEAVAALRRGESVMIFPEGWLRRREDQPMRRFAQGVHRILEEVPETPVVACWIEDGWGSFTSHKDGPPFKNKKIDFLRRIRIGIELPEVLPPDLLSDAMATRRHLMNRVRHARTYLGLAEHPMPIYGSGEEG